MSAIVHRRGVFVIDPDHLLRVAVVGEAHESNLRGGRAIDRFDDARSVAPHSSSIARICVPVASFPTTLTMLTFAPASRGPPQRVRRRQAAIPRGDGATPARAHPD